MDNLIFGINPVLEAFRSENVTVDKIFILKSKRDRRIQEIINYAKKNNAKIRFLEKNFFKKFKNFNHQGIVAEIVNFKYTDFQELLKLNRDKIIYVLLDSITDVQNLGNIIRTCEFFGVNGIIIPKDKSASINNTVIKTSSGAVFNLPVSKVTNLNNCIEKLKEKGFFIVGTSSKAEKSFSEINQINKICLIIGNEEKGIRESILKKCDLVAGIKGYGKTSSLNAASAAAISVYEIIKRLRI